MAEGAMPGAPQISGTEDDSQHFYHQPPPVEGVNFGSQPEAIDHATSNEPILQPPEELRPDSGDRQHWHSHVDTGEDTDSPESPLAGSPVLSPVPPASPTLHGSPLALPSQPDTPRRAHFPSEPTQLTRTYSAPRRTRTDTVDATAYDGTYDGEKDREPAAHRGVWQSFRNWFTSWRDDLGSPDKDQDIQDLIGDIGIDLQTIRRITGKGKKSKKGSHARVSSLIAPSVMLARPGLGARTESTSTIQTTTGSTTVVGSGATTPSTLRRIFGSGVDPHDLSKALKRLKIKAAKGDSKQAKYVQAKAELAHRRNLVLLMVSCLGSSLTRMQRDCTPSS